MSTLHDVARRAGVSFKTVSNVVNNYPYVSEKLREAVWAAIKELDYRPNQTARALRKGRTGVIGLAVPELDLPYFAALASDVIAAAEARDYKVIVERTNRDRDRELETLLGSRRRMTDGLIINPLAMTVADIPLLQSTGPTVLLGEALFASNVDHVTVRNVAGAYAATRYLLEMGHRQIGIVGARAEDLEGTPGLRVQGYKQALVEAGIAFDPNLLSRAIFWQRREGASAMDTLLEACPDVTAVFALNDTLALGAIFALQKRGLRVPEDVSVIGWDDLEEGTLSLPALSTVDGGRHEIAKSAVETLLDRIENPEKETSLVELPFELIIRGSTGPVRPA